MERAGESEQGRVQVGHEPGQAAPERPPELQRGPQPTANTGSA